GAVSVARMSSGRLPRRPDRSGRPRPAQSPPVCCEGRMADRAYLYSDDRPDAWDVPEEGYYDSRWTLPLAWFFFFRPEDVRLIDAGYGGSRWREVRLSAEKAPARERFERRRPLLMSVIGHRLGEDAVARFAATVGRRHGR